MILSQRASNNACLWEFNNTINSSNFVKFLICSSNHLKKELCRKGGLSMIKQSGCVSTAAIDQHLYPHPHESCDNVLCYFGLWMSDDSGGWVVLAFPIFATTKSQYNRNNIIITTLSRLCINWGWNLPSYGNVAWMNSRFLKENVSDFAWWRFSKWINFVWNGTPVLSEMWGLLHKVEVCTAE